MAKLLVRVLHGKATSLNLSSKKIDEVARCVGRLTNISVLLLNNNFISTLPAEMLSLQHVSPLCLVGEGKSKDNGFNPCTRERFVTKYPCFCKLAELNLGNNALKVVPAVLGHLGSLKKLYLFSNQITAVPPEVMGRLTRMCFEALSPI